MIESHENEETARPDTYGCERVQRAIAVAHNVAEGEFAQEKAAAHLSNPSVGKADHAIGTGEHMRIMASKDDRGFALKIYAPQDLEHLTGRALVQRGGWLIGEDDVNVAR